MTDHKILIPSPEYDALMRRFKQRLSLSPKLLAMIEKSQSKKNISVR